MMDAKQAQWRMSDAERVEHLPPHGVPVSFAPRMEDTIRGAAKPPSEEQVEELLATSLRQLAVRYRNKVADLRGRDYPEERAVQIARKDMIEVQGYHPADVDLAIPVAATLKGRQPPPKSRRRRGRRGR